MASRIIVRIDITPAARKQLDRLTERYGMTQVEMLSRVTEWLARQPDAIKAAVLGQYVVDGAPDAAALIVRAMGASSQD